jgi:nicotinic acid mononucleotide adenylyltransferase
MTRSIAVYGGSFNPPGIHHRRIAEALRTRFDEVVVVPCGPRPDKPQASAIAPVYRAALADVAFKGINGVEVDLFDLEQATFTRTHELDKRYAPRGEVWHAVGSDLITGGRRGESFIHRVWQNGPGVWRALNFAVVGRRGHDFGPEDLPPRHRVIEAADADGSSAALRERLYRGRLHPPPRAVPGQLPQPPHAVPHGRPAGAAEL